MKIITSIFLWIFFVAVFCAFNFRENKENSQNGITFYEGKWEDALALSKKENKLIFLDAYASWCGPCRVMSWKVFPNKKVGAFFNTSFINLSVDMEKGDGPVLSHKYNIQAYPTLIFITPEGTVKKYSVGYHNVNDLIDLGKEALK